MSFTVARGRQGDARGVALAIEAGKNDFFVAHGLCVN